MSRTPSGHIEQLPSGSWRAKVYAGKDPLTGREIRFRKTRRTEVEAQIELGKLLALARAGGQPDSAATVADLIDEYVPVAGWDVSTEETNLGYIRRTIKPAFGTAQLTQLREWVDGVLRVQYPGYKLPDCWPAHREALWELGVLHAEWQRIFDDPRGADLENMLWFHERWLPGTLSRLDKAISNATPNGNCRAHSYSTTGQRAAGR